MKYKHIKIERPEWCEIGTVVRIKDKEGTFTILGGTDKYAIIKEWNGLFEVLLEDLTPVPAWEPKPGEYCAFWDDGDTRFLIGKYNDTKNGTHILNSNPCSWSHVARIAGVDCACSAEELKDRTDWL